MNRLLMKKSMAMAMALSMTFTTLGASDCFACGKNQYQQTKSVSSFSFISRCFGNFGEKIEKAFSAMGMYFGGYKGDKDYKDGSDNDVMLQGFEWTLEDTGTLWNVLLERADDLEKVGIDSIWLPPAYKGTSSSDVGYGAYDLYDLGEFDQHGTVRTKYGTKDEYLSLIDTLHDNNIKVYADIVLNHKASADDYEEVDAVMVNSYNRLEDVSDTQKIGAWTVFNFPGRNGAYSSFTWNANCFDGVDWDQNTYTSAVYRFADKTWDDKVSTENGNYDYLMYADIDFDNKEVVRELTNWGAWYVNTAELDGFRLDAVKHIDSDFYKKWLKSVSRKTGKKLDAVGEYYSGSTQELENYIDATGNEMSLFDFTLQGKFKNAGDSNGAFDMSTLFDGTFVSEDSKNAVTFVENHDTQPGQSLEATVSNWFKPLAYTAILTRQEGTPCVFYGDYYGTVDESIASYKSEIDELLLAREYCAYGKQKDYIDDENIIGWTRTGNKSNKCEGLAALINDGVAGSKVMNVGRNNAGETWIDITGNVTESVIIGRNGKAEFKVNEKSYSVWVSTKIAAKINAIIAELPEVKPANGVDPENNKITLYYNSSWDNTNIHYQIGSKAWTDVPGVAMEESDINGYDVFTADLGTSKYFKCVFNNGNGTWDNNNNNNYVLTAGTYYIYAGVVNEGTPEAIEEPIVETGTVKLYYSTGWTTPYAHYGVNDSNWTSVPGMAMTASTEYAGYYEYEFEMSADAYVKMCFNDGGSNWDSNYGSNYTFNIGTYTVKDGVITEGTPVIEEPTVETGTVKLYYSTGWTTPYAHYGINNSNWTSVPGMAMTASTEYAGYYEYEFEMSADAYVKMCFNDGGSNWDSNYGSNYTFNIGTYTVKDGVITEGTPQ